MKKARFSATEQAKALWRSTRHVRKGLEDQQHKSEGVICAAGAFDTANPGHNGQPGYVQYCVIFMVYSLLFYCLVHQ